jgi:Tfp pilus assembly protein PilO
MNQYLSKLAALEWGKVVGIGVALAVAYWFFMFDNGSTIETSIKNAQERAEKAKKTLSETEKAIADADRFGREVQSTQDQFEKIVRFMPMSLDAGEMTKMINEISQDVGVRPRIEPQKDEPAQGFTQAVKVNLQLEGNYAQIVTFLSKISQMQRLLVFDKIELNPANAQRMTPNGGASLALKGTLIGYRYLKDAADPADGAAKPGTALKPTPPPAKARGT